jgi:2-polyprenyl-6-methoxyphenol hydroxylase-like FAD-dependent oxidoreductase
MFGKTLVQSWYSRVVEDDSHAGNDNLCRIRSLTTEAPMNPEARTETTERRALIIGCGIAGPVLAMFLQRVGITPVIYEGRPEPRDEAGFFLNLAPNGLNVLDTLGIKDEIREAGTPTTSIVFQNHRGKKLTENSEATTLLKRRLLTKTLREAAIERGITVEFGKRLTDVEITRGAVTALFADGSEGHGDLLVGCDGIHSRTRWSVMPDAPTPNYAGVIDSGGFTHSASVPPSDGVFRMTFGMEGFFGYQVVPSGEIYWFENFHQPTEPDRGELDAIPIDEWRAKLLDIHRADHEPIREIIRSTEDGIGKWPNYEVPTLPTWHEGPVCLIGDAAHAMLPSSGQGASMAMEDAIMLAKCLRDIPDVENAFGTFERLRKDRVEKEAKDARRNSNRKAPSNVITRKIRDLVLPFFLRMGVKSAEQTYSYEVDWGERVTMG